MENSEHPAPGPRHGNMPKILLVAAIVILVVIAGACVWQYSEGKSLSKDNSKLSAQTVALKKQIKQQNDINKGVPQSTVAYKDPAGGLGLLNGDVTFTMPAGWVRTITDNCSGGLTRDNAVLCYDVAAIQPSNAEFSWWSATVSVYEYSKADGTARQWVENKLFDSFDSFTQPIVSAESVNNDSAITFSMVGGTADNPDYVNMYYVVVHGKYGIVVAAQLQDGGVYGGYGGTHNYDYRQAYQPILKQFVQSVRFKD